MVKSHKFKLETHTDKKKYDNLFIKIRSVNSSAAFLWAIILTILAILSNIYIFKELPSEGLSFWQMFRSRLFYNGWLPLVILGVFHYGMIIIIQIHTFKFRPLINSSQHENELIKTVRLAARNRDNILKFKKLENKVIGIINQRAKDNATGYYTERFIKLYDKKHHAANMEAVRELSNEMLENDEDDFASSFIPLRLTEWALPLLGFLGTVIGVSAAISSMGDGVQIAFEEQRLTNEVMDYFSSGFQNLALAFDTTFLGLFFVVIIGTFRFRLKKAVTKEFVFARELFTDVIANWDSESSLLFPLENINASMQINNARLSEIENIYLREFSENYKSIKKFNYFVFDIFETVIDEADGFENIKKVLFNPIVEASIKTNIITKAIKPVVIEYTAIDIALNTNHYIVICLNQKDRSSIQYLSIEDKKINSLVDYKEQIQSIFISCNCQSYIAITETNKVIYGYLSNEITDPKLIAEINFTEDSIILPVGNTKYSQFLFIYNSNSQIHFDCVIITEKVELKNVQVDEQLHVELNKKVLRYYAYYQNLFAVVFKTDTENTIVIFELQEKKHPIENNINKSSSVEPKIERTFLARTIGKCIIEEDISNIVINTNNTGDILDCEILFTTQPDDIIYFWPIKSTYEKIKPNALSINPKTKLSNGTNGWIGIVSKQRLHFRQIKNRRIKDNATSFKVESDLISLKAVSNGRYLIGISDKHPYLWEFPISLIESKKRSL